MCKRPQDSGVKAKKPTRFEYKSLENLKILLAINVEISTPFREYFQVSLRGAGRPSVVS